MQSVLQSTMAAFPLYGRKNQRLLYDILCQLTFATGAQHVNSFFPTLMEHVQQTPWYDLQLGVIMETIGAIAGAGAEEQVGFRDYLAHVSI